MSDTEISDLLEDLESQISSLKSLLKPVTSKSAQQDIHNLPVLDQAKANVLVAYASHSMIFNALKLQGKDPKEHPVFQELARTRKYFERIKEAEEKGAAAPEGKDNANAPRSRVDTAVAGRFIKAGLEGNERLDRERAQKAQSGQWQGTKKMLDEDAMDVDAEEDGFERVLSKDEKREQKIQRRAERKRKKDDTGNGEESTDHGVRRGTKKMRLEDQAEKAQKQADSPKTPATPAAATETPKGKTPKSRRKKSSKTPRGPGEVAKDLLGKGPGKSEKG